MAYTWNRVWLYVLLGMVISSRDQFFDPDRYFGL